MRWQQVSSSPQIILTEAPGVDFGSERATGDSGLPNHAPVANPGASNCVRRNSYESGSRFRCQQFAADQTRQIKDVPQPQPGPNQALLKMHASGICYTGVHLAFADARTALFSQCNRRFEPSWPAGVRPTGSRTMVMNNEQTV